MSKAKRIIKISVLSFVNVILLAIVIVLCILYGRLASMMSVKKKGENLYTMNYKQNYHLDKVLNAKIVDEDDLFKYICKELFFGYQVDTNIEQYGCSAFATQTPEGDNTVGRNFDLKGTDTLCLYTHPRGGYKSISTVSTDMVAVGGDNKTTPKSFIGRASLLVAPYICVDGMNEKGLSASLLDMSYGETHMNTDKPNLIVTLAIRLLMDRASTVDEAINLLKQYDIQTAHGWTQHIFISDASGKSAIVEWVNGEINIVNYNVCTNFWMSDPTLNGDYSNQCYRFDLIDTYLKMSDSFKIEDSMLLLRGARQGNTVWSVVYNLDQFEADYAINGRYNEIYHINPKNTHEGAIIIIVIIVNILAIAGITYLIIKPFIKKKSSNVEEKNIEE